MAYTGTFHPLLVHFPIASVLAGAAGAIGAALLSSRLPVPSRRSFVYRVTLFVTALLVAITGHLGGTLVWGAGFLQR